jgi:hypothetical protein
VLPVVFRVSLVSGPVRQTICVEARKTAENPAKLEKTNKQSANLATKRPQIT